MKYIILITFIILIVILIFNYFNNYEYFSNKNSLSSKSSIIFLTKTQVLKLLEEDKDNYYKRFNKYDLYARHVTSIKEYKNIIKSSPINLTNEQKNKIKNSIKIVDTKTSGIPDFDFPWKIGGISGKNYENGLPHTRDDVILLPANKIDNKTDIELAKLLCHEKVHIYQKLYPKYVDKYLKDNKIKILKKREENDMVRANPDLDNNIYYDNKIIYSAKYNSNKPKSIEDITYGSHGTGTQMSEHPFEKMAIEFEDII